MNGQIRALRVAPIVAGLLLMGASFHTARAQVAPDQTRPAATPTGNWWDMPNGAGQPPARLPERDDLSRTQMPPARQNYGNVTDYPGPQMSDWVVANAMAARARAVAARAETELAATVRRLQYRFEHSKDYLDALVAEKQAYADYTDARQKVLILVANDPKYHAIGQLRDELGEKIAIRRAAKDAPKDEILAMATLKMQYASDARAIEVAALSSDDSVKAAREKMVQVSRKLIDLRARFDDSLHDNPEIVVARHVIDDAKISVIETNALAYGAAVSSAYALNYSYFLHRNDNGGIFGPYGPSGNGGSYNSPFWVH